ncbi:MAG: ribonuclease P protein component [bacterium]|nr:ribonuclease P protein component [bacterium]
MSVKIRSLTKDKDFDRIFKQGRSCYGQIIGLKVLANELGQNRLGVIISRKVSKKAVERNKFKRRVKEVFRLQADKTITGYDILVIALSGAKKNALRRIPSYQEIKKEIEQGLSRLRMFKL